MEGIVAQSVGIYETMIDFPVDQLLYVGSLEIYILVKITIIFGVLLKV